MQAERADLAVLERPAFAALLEELVRRGYTLIGPTVRDRAIVVDEIDGVDDLPAGWTDEQDGGTYRLRRRDDDALFGFATGPDSFKRHQLPPSVRVWRARREPGGALTGFEEASREPQRLALVGVRSCDLHAMGILDRVLLGDAHADPADCARREDVFVLAVQCGQAGGTCFCASMGTGPTAAAGFDLAVTELTGDGRHAFVAQVGSPLGAAVLAAVPHAGATAADRAAAAAAHDRAAAQMGRTLQADGLRELLYRNAESPRWEAIADRCLTCGNCTMVCPTCFCTSIEDVTDLDGEHVERHRHWDSCFTVDHSHLHGGAVRPSGAARYRQWMTHKLASWIDQFGSSGCVGCGRCITWCPVAIDITEEAAVLRAEEQEAGDGRA